MFQFKCTFELIDILSKTRFVFFFSCKFCFQNLFFHFQILFFQFERFERWGGRGQHISWEGLVWHRKREGSASSPNMLPSGVVGTLIVVTQYLIDAVFRGLAVKEVMFMIKLCSYKLCQTLRTIINIQELENMCVKCNSHVLRIDVSHFHIRMWAQAQYYGLQRHAAHQDNLLEPTHR